MELLLILFVIFLAASCIYVLMQRKEKDDCSTNYVLRETLLSPAERSFFDTLKHSASEHMKSLARYVLLMFLCPKLIWIIILGAFLFVKFHQSILIMFFVINRHWKLLQLLRLKIKVMDCAKQLTEISLFRTYAEIQDYHWFVLMLKPIIRFSQ